MATPPTASYSTLPVNVTMTLLTNRFMNKGTAFTMEEREALGIMARVPPRVETIEQQIARCMMQFDQLEMPINKYQLLANIHSANTTLYYAMLTKYPEKMLPIIYTPTVGEACQKFCGLYQRERGLYITSSMRHRVREFLDTGMYPTVDIIVVTDGSRILGLGDLGANGMGISLGKASLYVVGAGLKPRRTLPVLLDCGTSNEKLRNDPTYMGQAVPRISDDEFYAILDEFMAAASELWPNAVIQFEDFSNNHCFDMLERYQNKYRCFNDDIQGTGAVVSAGFYNAIRASGVAAMDQRVVVFGAGSAAVGVVKSIAELVAFRNNVPAAEVLKCFYLVDTKGLVTTTRGDKLQAHKVLLARTDVDAETSAKLATLDDVMAFVKPTAFLGLGGVGPVLTQPMVEGMLANCSRPIIFPLSNPTSKAECNPVDVYHWTKGRAIIASGSPFPETVVDGKLCKPSQGNNMYVFPGLGLGASMALPAHISEDVILAASACLQALLTPEDEAKGLLYPPLSQIRAISAEVAAAVIEKCQRDGTATTLLPTTHAELLQAVEAHMWQPVYAPSMMQNII